MKITFNPTIKNYQTNYKPLKSNSAPMKSYANINGLNCLANYDLTFCSRTPRAIYAIDYDGNYEKIESISKVENAVSGAIGAVLDGRCAVFDNRTYIYADCAESSDGKIDSNAIYKAILRFQNAQNQPLYAIDFNGNLQRFNNRKEASTAFNIPLNNINQVLNHTIETTNGYVFIRAFDVEMRDKNGKLLKDENNKPILDMETINKLREGFLYAGRGFAVVSIDKKGNIIQYQNLKEAAKKTANKRENIAQALSSGKITQGKYAFARLADVVLIDEFGDVVFDENNDFVIDYDKVEEFRQMAFEK